MQIPRKRVYGEKSQEINQGNPTFKLKEPAKETRTPPPQGVIQSKWPKNHGRTEFKRMSNCIRGLERSNRSRMSKKANWI